MRFLMAVVSVAACSTFAVGQDCKNGRCPVPSGVVQASYADAVPALAMVPRIASGRPVAEPFVPLPVREPSVSYAKYPTGSTVSQDSGTRRVLFGRLRLCR
jgi:hypothetical protein